VLECPISRSLKVPLVESEPDGFRVDECFVVGPCLLVGQVLAESPVDQPGRDLGLALRRTEAEPEAIGLARQEAVAVKCHVAGGAIV